jgi:4-amino-4-deoxy-L-arabinose transferase-like glycosyltransferase
MGFAALTTFVVIVTLAILALCAWIFFHKRRNKNKLFPLLELAQAKTQIALLLCGILLTILGEALKAGLPEEVRGNLIIFTILGILLFALGLTNINRPTPPKLIAHTLATIAKWLQVTPTQIVYLIASFLLAGIAILASGDALLMRAPLVALLAWVLAACLAFLGSWPTKPTGKSLNWKPFFIAAGLAALSFLLRGINTGGIPNTLTGDEASAGLFGVEFIHGQVDNILGFGWYSFPALYFYTQAISISLLGQTTEALRITSALAGALTVGAVYLAGRSLYGHRTGLYAAIFLAGLHFHIHFSRIGLNNIWDGFWFTVILGLVWWAWKHERRHLFLLAGLALGISQYDYVSVRMLFVLIPAWLIIASLADRARFKRNRASIILMFLIAIVVFLPLAANYARHFDQFMAPMQRVSLLGPWLDNEMQITGQPGWRILASQLWISLQAFTNTNLRHWYTPEVPMLRSFAAGFFLLGIALIGAEWKKPQHWLLLMWLGVFVVSGGMSESTPAAQRYIGAAPAAAIVLGYALAGISERLTSAFKRGAQAFAAIALGIVVLLAISDVNFYFSDFTNRGDYSGTNTAIADHLARYLLGKPDGTQVAFFGQPRMGYLSISTLPYLAPKAVGLDMGQPLGSAENPQINPGSVIFVFLPEHETDLNILRFQYPQLTVYEEKGLTGEFLYWYVEFSDYPNG